MAERSRDPRPLKRARTPPKDDDIVSLDSTEDEFEKELMVLAGVLAESRYVAIKRFLSQRLTKAYSVLKQVNSLALDFNKKSISFAAPMSDIKIETPEEWLLDSGASMHFTNDINDFIDYQVIKPTNVVTANGSTKIAGKGAVILIVEGQAIRVEPVYHVPDLTCKLISLGEFLQSGLYTRGTSHSISVQEGSENYLTFYPSEMNPNLYTIKAIIYKEEALQKAVPCIYTVDFEVMHRRLAHPSHSGHWGTIRVRICLEYVWIRLNIPTLF
jgi:hypothetical protein